MEKTWEDFWTTGKVTDYLAYRGCTDAVYEPQKEQKEQMAYGTAGGVDRDGFNSHAGA